jgi:osmotically-inducible protein OsmY
MTLKSLVQLSASLCLGLSLCGCSSATPDAPATVAVEKRFDHQIVDDVRSKIQKDPRLQGTSITVMCDAGTVILSGSVNSREQFGAAQILAAGTLGAKGVINRLQVTPEPDKTVSPDSNKTAH